MTPPAHNQPRPPRRPTQLAPATGGQPERREHSARPTQASVGQPERHERGGPPTQVAPATGGQPGRQEGGGRVGEVAYFAELSSPEVRELVGGARTPVLLLPVGAVEPHGPHAPLGTDGIISAGMCERAARHLAGDPVVRVLILPGLPYGVTRYAAAFPGAVSVSEETLHGLVVDTCTSLVLQGLPRILVVNNHFEPEHLAVLRRAVEAMRGVQGSRVAHLDLVRRRYASRLTPEFQAGECHAGRYETSLVLADQPGLVDVERMSTLPRVAVDMPTAMAQGRTDFIAMGMTEAYCGSPAEATADEGEATFDVLSTMLVEAIRELL